MTLEKAQHRKQLLEQMQQNFSAPGTTRRGCVRLIHETSRKNKEKNNSIFCILPLICSIKDFSNSTALCCGSTTMEFRRKGCWSSRVILGIKKSSDGQWDLVVQLTARTSLVCVAAAVNFSATYRLCCANS